MSPTMARQTLKVAGWTSRKVGSVLFYGCPGCRHCQDILFGGCDNLAECSSCHEQFPAEDFTKIQRKRTILKCGDCGREVPLIPSYYGFLGYICPDCSNYVAIHYGKQALQPSSVLDVNWNPTLVDRGVSLSGGELWFASCKTVRDYLVVRVLQAIAKQEDGRFLSLGAEKEHLAGLLLDSKRHKYLGFIVWTEDKYAVLRQIFIVEQKRRKGHAKRLVRFWVERYADRVHPKFGIEAPNEKALSLHAKLGHIKIEGDSFRSIKCFLVPSFR